MSNRQYPFWVHLLKYFIDVEEKEYLSLFDQVLCEFHVTNVSIYDIYVLLSNKCCQEQPINDFSSHTFLPFNIKGWNMCFHDLMTIESSFVQGEGRGYVVQGKGAHSPPRNFGEMEGGFDQCGVVCTAHVYCIFMYCMLAFFVIFW